MVKRNIIIYGINKEYKDTEAKKKIQIIVSGHQSKQAYNTRREKDRVETKSYRLYIKETKK